MGYISIILYPDNVAAAEFLDSHFSHSI